ncbi:MAG: DUF5106 domain-containing protein [Clostridium sp.]|nr:DUF5106 domain-containing protein [Clostridium sp.]
MEYPLPSVPDSIRMPVERAKYATSRFWDNYDANAPYATDLMAMQQALANFSAIAQAGGNEGADEAAMALVKKAAHNAKAAGILSSAADICLEDRESPVHNSQLYAAFVRVFTQTNGLPEWIHEKYATLWRLMNLNNVGEKAANIDFRLRSGESSTLWNEIGKEYTALILYDPECEHCDAIISRFAAEPIVEKWIDAGMAKVVAVDIRPSESSTQKANSMPKTWIVGADTQGIEEEEAYYIPSTPAFYLLDASGTVILKDADATDVLETIWMSKK